MGATTIPRATERERALPDRAEAPRPAPWRLAVLCAAAAWAAGLASVALARAPEPVQDCTSRCHEKVAKGRHVHPDAADRCETCHGRIEMGDGPHKAPGRTAKGLIKEASELCHDCHKRSEFEGKFSHAPVESAPCAECHVSHASDHPGLLRKDAAALCLGCHEEVSGKPHLVASFSRPSHPVGSEKPARLVPDPLNASRPFSCVSCHESHRSSFPRLLKMEFRQASGYCTKCHPI